MADDLQGLGTTPEFRDLLFSLQNWRERPKMNVKTNVRLFGFEGTVKQVINQSDDQPHDLDFLVTLENLEQIFQFLTFFHSRRARLERFWFPLPYGIFSLVGQQLSGNTVLKVNSPTFFYRGFERIYILLSNGDLITREVTAVNEVAGELFFTVAALDRTIEESDVELCSLLLLCRFDNNDVKLKYKPYTAADTNIKLKELITEYSEV